MTFILKIMVQIWVKKDNEAAYPVTDYHMVSQKAPPLTHHILFPNTKIAAALQWAFIKLRVMSQ